MFPGIYGFAWDTGHIVFLGAFYGVLTAIFCTVTAAVVRTGRDFLRHRSDEIRWRVDFHDLPESVRRCRHEMNGDVTCRPCDNAFDCRSCASHARLVAARAGAKPRNPGSTSSGGFAVPSDRLHHRGHTWVRPDGDGLLEVGLDDLAIRVFGAPERVELPPVGSRIRVGATAWRMFKRGVVARVLSPLDGTVVGRGAPEEAYFLKVRPEGGKVDTRHLLGGADAEAWMLREAERVQVALSPAGVGAALADGGAPLEDLSQVMTPEQLDAVCGEIFLEP